MGDPQTPATVTARCRRPFPSFPRDRARSQAIPCQPTRPLDSVQLSVKRLLSSVVVVSTRPATVTDATELGDPKIAPGDGGDVPNETT